MSLDNGDKQLAKKEDIFKTLTDLNKFYQKS